MNKIVNYFRSSWLEAKKVSWPTKKQTTVYSLIVIGLSLGFALFFMVLDYIFNYALENLIIR